MGAITATAHQLKKKQIRIKFPAGAPRRGARDPAASGGSWVPKQSPAKVWPGRGVLQGGGRHPMALDSY